MDAIFSIALLAVGTTVFVLVNRVFHVAYFGFRGVFALWMTCILGTGMVLAAIGAVVIPWVMEYYPWLLGGLAVIVLGISRYKKNAHKG